MIQTEAVAGAAQRARDFIVDTTRHHAFWATFLVLVYLPLQVIRQWSSWSLYLTLDEMFVSCAVVAVFLYVFALLPALLSSIVGNVLAQLRIRDSVRKLDALLVAIAMIVALGGMARVLQVLTTLQAGGPYRAIPAFSTHSVTIRYSLVLIGIVSLMIAFTRPRMLDWCSRLGDRWRAIGVRLIWVELGIVLGLATFGNLAPAGLDQDRSEAHSAFRTEHKMAPVIWITIDTLSAKHAFGSGEGGPNMPNLLQLASRGVLFDSAVSDSNFTTPSVTSLLTGKRVGDHKVYQLEARLRGLASEQNLAAILSNSGYRTAAVVANVYAHPVNLNLDGFDLVTAVPRHRACGFVPCEVNDLVGIKGVPLLAVKLDGFAQLSRLMELGPWRPKEAVPRWDPRIAYDRSLKIIDSWRKDSRPYFMWVHTLPPHAPFLPPQEYRKRWLNDARFDDMGDYAFARVPLYRYTEGIPTDELRLVESRYVDTVRYADAELGRFLLELESRGVLNEAIVVVTSDHGESFGRWVGHGGPLLERGAVEIPMIVVAPGVTEGVRHPSTAQLSDVAPTTLSLLGISQPIWMSGQPLLDSKGIPIERSAPVITAHFQQSKVWGAVDEGSIALIDGRFKLVRYIGERRYELYDWNSFDDRADLSSVFAETTDTMRKKLDAATAGYVVPAN